MAKKVARRARTKSTAEYDGLLRSVTDLLEAARHAVARSGVHSQNVVNGWVKCYTPAVA